MAHVFSAEERYRILADNATDMVSEVTPEGVWTWVSPSVTSLLGWAPEDLIGRNAFEFIHPDDLAPGRDLHDQMTDGRRATIEIRVRMRDGSYRWVSSSGRAVLDDAGQVISRIAGWRDIQSEVAAREALAASEERYRLLAENAADLVWQSNTEGVILWVSPSITSVLGWQPEDVIGHQSLEFINMSDHADVLRERARVLQGHTLTKWLGRYRCADHNFRWMSVQVRPIMSATGEVTGLIVGLRDVQEEVLAREALARSERKFRLALDGAPQGMAIVSLARQFMTVNESMCRMVGRSRSWLLSHSLEDLLTPEDNERDLLARDKLLAEHGTHATNEVRMLMPDGRRIWVTHSIGLLREDDGMPLFYVSQYQDVTEHHQLTEDLAYQADHDALTGLLNQATCLRELDRACSVRARGGSDFAVLFCDLDDFKDVNDSYGHIAGDAVLCTVAERMRGAVRGSDMVARLGGDEFVVLLRDIHTPVAAQAVATKIRAAVAVPCELPDAEPVAVRLSVGIAISNATESPETLLAHADSALYQAKSLGRDQVVCYAE